MATPNKTNGKAFDPTWHAQTWTGFTKFLTYSVVGVVVTLVVLALLLL
ncbi:MAG TPA: aa3-type cytochrome c oxidase subunit IV [Azospirillaceae bacterium]|nr:aa3-type cytochrome c oxidase subunit IV [Azospirillaceae bacterium]